MIEQFEQTRKSVATTITKILSF